MIANFDETNVFFSPTCKMTLSPVGERTISVRSADSAQRCTVMIGVSGWGYMFPPIIIFKGSIGPRGRILQELEKVATKQLDTHHGLFSGYPLSNFYAVQEKAWMDTTSMLQWVEKVWKPFTMEKMVPQPCSF